MIRAKSDFSSPLLLRNPHVQTVLSSTVPRKWLVRRAARQLLADSETHILECGNGVRLQGEYAGRSANQKGLVIMLHGWEGCAESLYVLSSGSRLYAEGYNVFRLNLRDHGPTHHLNKELFNSVRLNEVLGAVKFIHRMFPHRHNFMVGFSLGGNFSLRVATKAPQHQIALARVVAICPVLNPVHTMESLSNGWFVYHDYFRNRWQRSLQKKLKFYPELGYQDKLLTLKTLKAMNDYFVPNHTDYDVTHDYLMGYALVGNVLADLDVPSHIIASDDDPVIDARDLSCLSSSDALMIERYRQGGHCGFLENYRLSSWVDKRIVELLGQ